ncbi:MAG: hypothetical protein ACM3TN_18655 [Alphaproteobacteria bacterium]
MFVRRATFEMLLDQIQTQEQEIENLTEKLGILAQFLDEQFQVNVEEGWRMLAAVPPELIKFIDARWKEAHLFEL